MSANSSSLTRRQLLAATAAATLAPGAQAVLAQTAGSPPNIIFIMADDLGYADLSSYGRRDYSTPNIDRIATGGLQFMQAYSNSAVCSATRAALITGRYQYRLPVGLEEPLVGRNVGMPPDHPTLPSLLKKAGYGTTLIGKWHLGRLPEFGPLQSGYDHFWGFREAALDYYTHKAGPPGTNTDDLWDHDVKVQQNGYLTDLIGERAVSAIDDYAKAKRSFLLSVHFNAPHWPWEAPGDETESQRIKALFHWDGGSLQTYARMVRAMDVQVGRILEKLESVGIANNTVVILTSDNGGERFSDTWPFSGKKTELLEGGLRIPALMRWPGRIAPGSKTQQVTITMDWAPTLLALAGTKPDPAYPPDGMNLAPFLNPNAAPVSRKLFWRYKVNTQRAMRDGDMKWLQIAGNTFLFNVVTDPLERANLKDRQPGVYQRLAAEYEKWNATMLPLDTESFSGSFTGERMADHFSNQSK